MMMRVSTVIDWFIFVMNGMLLMMLVNMARLLIIIINVAGIKAVFLVGIFKVMRWIFLNMMIGMFLRIGCFMVIKMRIIVKIIVRIIVRIIVWFIVWFMMRIRFLW